MYRNGPRLIRVDAVEDWLVTATVIEDSDPDLIGVEILLTVVELCACYNPEPA
jgi:hypothetical protein